MYPKILDAKATEDYQLYVTFSNHVTKKINMAKKIKEQRFMALQDKFLFKNVQVDKGGYGISWTDDIDISEYEAWQEGEALN